MRLLQATATLPIEIDVPVIAEAATQAAFATIARGLGLAGYPVTGDFAPEEVREIDDTFRAFVHAMALNNPTIASLQHEHDGGPRCPKCDTATTPLTSDVDGSVEYVCPTHGAVHA